MITVILATWNGARSIEQVLEGLALQERPGVPWRLVAVDNGSTDRTARLLGDYIGRLPITILREPKPGKSRAVNRALAEVGEGLVVFIDDDTVPEADWLRQFETAATKQHDHDLFAGRIRAQWETEPPAWLLEWDELDACYGIHVERPEGPCPPHLLYGGNMAIRAEAIGAHRFDEGYGPFQVPTFAMCGETEFVGRLAAAGRKSWFCRDAVAYHAIPARHLEPAWLLNRATNFGRGQFRIDADPLYAARGGWRTRLALRAAMGVARFRVRAAGLRGNEAAAFRARWRSSYLAGFAAELEAARREAKSNGSAAARNRERYPGLDPRTEEAG
jgi:GT2 family glycosyltransferase